jgi:hypothetical protein
MMKMVNSYDSSFPNNLQRPTFNNNNIQQNNSTEYRLKPQSPTSSHSLSTLTKREEYDKRFIHANNKYPSPRIPPPPNNLKPSESFNSDSRNFVTKSLKQIKPLSFENKQNPIEFKTNETKTVYSESNKTSLSENDSFSKNFYQPSKEQTVKPVALCEKKLHTNHSNNLFDNSNEPTNEVVKVPRPKINKSYLIKMKRKHKNKISANLSGTKFDISN